MRKLAPILLVAILVCGGLYLAYRAQSRFGSRAVRASAGVRRIVSLAPSVTETVFALGAGDRLVGVTRYCNYPPEAKHIEQVGGYIDPSFEAIVRLKPDLVIVTSGNNDNAEKLRRLGIRALSVDHNTIDGIMNSIGEIGRLTGEQKNAQMLASGIRSRMRDVEARTQGLPRPGVLISIGRSVGGGLGEIYVAGKDNFYDEIIRLAGGTNAYDSRVARTPALSGEGVTRLNPDIIIDFMPGKSAKDAANAIRQWDNLPHVSAVRSKKVFALTGDYVVLPGPRFIDTLEDVARMVHPEVDWGSR